MSICLRFAGGVCKTKLWPFSGVQTGDALLQPLPGLCGLSIAALLGETGILICLTPFQVCKHVANFFYIDHLHAGLAASSFC